MLVATASLELGIDIGDVDLVIQIGASRSIATLLQRVGRAGHGVAPHAQGSRLPAHPRRAGRSGRARSQHRGRRARPHPAARAPARHPRPADRRRLRVRDVGRGRAFRAACVARGRTAISRANEFDDVVGVHLSGRWSLLHRDGVGRRIRATRRARITAITSGGAIPDNADYQVILEPEGTLVGTLNEDFAIESNGGDIFQLGTASWRILRVSGGVVRVADAKGAPPTIPFWLGEAPGAHGRALQRDLARARSERTSVVALAADGVGEPRQPRQIAEYIAAGERALGAVPTQKTRGPRALLRRERRDAARRARSFRRPHQPRLGARAAQALLPRVRLRAASGGQRRSHRALARHPAQLPARRGVRLPAPRHRARLARSGGARRSDVQDSLALERVARACSSIACAEASGHPRRSSACAPTISSPRAFPAAMACGETLPPGRHRSAHGSPHRQADGRRLPDRGMDVEGFLDVLRGLRDGRIERRAVDTPEPSAFAQGILAAQPYTFLDDAPLEERRTQAVLARRTLDVKTADELGALDPEAIRRVREEAWPAPINAEEVHEALLWMGYATVDEAAPWDEWLAELRARGRVMLEGDRWFAFEASRDPKEILRGRLEALGPVVSDDPLLYELESEGFVLRGRFEGKPGWCSRRLLARIHRYTLDRLRKEIEPVTAADFLRFLACWQHLDEEHRLEGPRGVAEVVRQLAGFEVPAAGLGGERLARAGCAATAANGSTSSRSPARWPGAGCGAAEPARFATTPICLVPRDELDDVDLARQAARHQRAGRRRARDPRRALDPRGDVSARAGSGQQALARRARKWAGRARGAGPRDLRLLWRAAHAARSGVAAQVRTPVAGRWSLLRHESVEVEPVEAVARQLLRRTGVVFRRTIAREKQPLPWRDLVRMLRTLEARGEVRGGRFVAGFDGEQYALPEAVSLLRAVRRRGPGGPVQASAADPLNFRGILTPDERVSPLARQKVLVA